MRVPKPGLRTSHPHNERALRGAETQAPPFPPFRERRDRPCPLTPAGEGGRPSSPALPEGRPQRARSRSQCAAGRQAGLQGRACLLRSVLNGGTGERQEEAAGEAEIEHERRKHGRGLETLCHTPDAKGQVRVDPPPRRDPPPWGREGAVH